MQGIEYFRVTDIFQIEQKILTPVDIRIHSQTVLLHQIPAVQFVPQHTIVKVCRILHHMCRELLLGEHTLLFNVSLASQGISISKTVKMKLNVFEYYNNFYKHVLEEEDYEKNRLQVYRFFIDAAGDGNVPPSILPGSKKLGDERVFVNTEILQAEGPAGDAYRKRKLLEHYLEPVALKGDLKVADVRLLLCLCEKHEWDSRRELADFAGISRTNLTSGLQRLTMKGFLKIEEVKEPKPSRKSKAAGEVQGKAEKPETRRKDRKTKVTVTILPTAEAVMKELALAQRDYDEARFVGFTEEELIKYADLSEKIKENTKRILG